MCVLCILWTSRVHTRLGLCRFAPAILALQLGLARCHRLSFRFGPGGGRWPRRISWTLPSATTCLGVLSYARSISLAPARTILRPWQITAGGRRGFVSGVGVRHPPARGLGCLFGIWRVSLSISLFATGAGAADRQRELSPQRLVDYVGFRQSAGVFHPASRGTITVLCLFSCSLAMLFARGGGAFGSPISHGGATGRTRGGSAKIAVWFDGDVGLDPRALAVSNVADHGRPSPVPLIAARWLQKEDARARSEAVRLDRRAVDAAGSWAGRRLDAEVSRHALREPLRLRLSCRDSCIIWARFLQVNLMAARDGHRRARECGP